MLTCRFVIHLLGVSKIWQGSAFDPIVVLKLGPWNFVLSYARPRRPEFAILISVSRDQDGQFGVIQTAMWKFCILLIEEGLT